VSTLPPLPPGFQLDAPQQPDIPPLPEGFTLDQQGPALPGGTSGGNVAPAPDHQEAADIGGIKGKVLGAVESAMNLTTAFTTGLAGQVGGLLGGVAGALSTGTFGTPEAANEIERVSSEAGQRATYQPQSGEAQRFGENVVAPVMQAGAPLLGHAPELAALHGAAAPAAQAVGDVGRAAQAQAGEAVGAAARKVLPVDPELMKVAKIATELKYPIDVRPDQVIENAKFSKLAGQAAADVPLAGSKTSSNQVNFTRNLIDLINPEETRDRLTPLTFHDAMTRSGEGIGEITSKTPVPLDEKLSAGLDALRADALSKGTTDDQRIIGNWVDEIKNKAGDGKVIDGTALREINSEIGEQARANPDNDLGRRLNNLQDVIQDAVERNVADPADVQRLKDFRRQYAYGKMIEPLVAKTIDGKISPQALMARVTATKRGKYFMARAAGGPIGDLAKVGQLIKEPGSSLTTERGLVYGTGLGAAGYVEPHSAAAAYGAANLYNRLGPKLTRAMVKGREGPPPAPPGRVEPTLPPPETLPGAGGPYGGGGEPPQGPLGDLTPDWTTTPGAGGPRTPPGGEPPPGTPAVEPPLALVPKRPSTNKAGKEVPAVPGKPGVPETIVAGREHELAADEATGRAMQSEGAAIARRAQAGAAEDRALAERKAAAAKEPKLPVGEVKEGQPELLKGRTTKIPTGEAREIEPEHVEPENPEIPVGEAHEITPEYIEAERAWRKTHGLGALDAERARTVARAFEIDPQRVEQLAKQFDKSPVRFDREIQNIIEEHHANETERAVGGSEGNAEAPGEGGGTAAPVQANERSEGVRTAGEQDHEPVPAAKRGAASKPEPEPAAAIRAADEHAGANGVPAAGRGGEEAGAAGGQGTHRPEGKSAVSEVAARGSDVVRRQKAVDEQMRRESQWQRLMGGKVDDAMQGMTKEEAQAHLDRLNAAPGDNATARAALEEKTGVGEPKIVGQTNDPIDGRVYQVKVPGDDRTFSINRGDANLGGKVWMLDTSDHWAQGPAPSQNGYVSTYLGDTRADALRNLPDVIKRLDASPGYQRGLAIRERPDGTGFDAYRDGKKVGYLNDNLKRGQAEQLGENANVDMVNVDKGERGKGVGKALYDAFNEKHGGRIMPSGKTEPAAWKLWKRNYPEKVDAFVKQEAQRIRDGADRDMVLGNIKDPEVAQRVADEAGKPEPDPFETDLAREGDKDVTETPAFKKWSGGAKTVGLHESRLHDFKGDEPVVVELMHGTVADFDAFDRSRANPESDLGAGFYFTNTPSDVAHNYATSEGADLQVKAERLAGIYQGRIANGADPELMKRFTDDTGISYLRLRNMIDAGDVEAYRLLDKTATELAKEDLTEHGGATVPVYVRFRKPLVLGGAHESFLDYDHNYNEATDSYGEPSGQLVKFLDAFRDELGSGKYSLTDREVDHVMGNIHDALADAIADGGVKASELERALHTSGSLDDITDNEGSFAGREAMRAAFENAGYDGIIDQGVNKKFGPYRQYGRPMTGVTSTTKHFVAFEPTQVKSSIGNRGTFDPNDPNILHSEGAPNEAPKPLGTPEALDRTLREKFGDKLIDGLQREGVLKYAAQSEEQPEGSRAMAVMHQKAMKPHASLYYDRLTAEQAPGVLMHELGEHYGIVRLLGMERYRLMLDDLQKLKDSGDPEVHEAWNHVKERYVDRQGTSFKVSEGDTVFMREVAARLVERSPDQHWVRRLINEIRAFFYQHFGTTMGNRVDSNLIRGLAAAALRKASTGDLPTAIPGRGGQPAPFRPFVPQSEGGSRPPVRRFVQPQQPQP